MTGILRFARVVGRNLSVLQEAFIIISNVGVRIVSEEEKEATEMIQRVFTGDVKAEKKHCLYCIGVIELAADMPR